MNLLPYNDGLQNEEEDERPTENALGLDMSPRTLDPYVKKKEL